MKEFEITIEEIISDTFKIQAKDIEEAMKITTEKYNKGEIVVNKENIDSRTMMVKDIENDEETNWIDF